MLEQSDPEGLVKSNAILLFKFRSGLHVFLHDCIRVNNVCLMSLVVQVQQHVNETRLLQNEVCKLRRCLQIICLITDSTFLKVFLTLKTAYRNRLFHLK